MGMLEYVLGYRKIIVSKKLVHLVAQNIKNLFNRIVSFVCNAHHINEPLVAYISLK